MDKNVKKIISEAFNELYSEMMSEAPAAPAVSNKNKITDEEVDGLIEKARRTGRGISYQWASNAESQNNFNLIIDALINDYKSTGNENSKRAIQNAFTPTLGNKIFNLASGSKFRNHSDIEDAVMTAFKAVMLDNFDNTLKSYRNDGTFSSLAMASMKNRVHDYIVRGWGQGTGDEDAWRASSLGPKSTETPLGGESGKVLGDTIPDSAMDISFSGIKGQATKQRAIKDALEWIELHVNEPEYKVNPKHYLAFKGLMGGDTTQDIFDENPEAFGNKKFVNIYFDRFLESKIAKEASELIAQIYGIEDSNWLTKINKLDMQQTFSQSKEFDTTGSHRDSERTEGIEEEFNAVKDFLMGLGDYFKSRNDIKPELSKKNKNGEFTNPKTLEIFNDLEVNEKFEEIGKLEKLLSALENAKAKDKAYGGYGSSVGDVSKDPRENLKAFMDKFGVDPSEYKNFEIRGTGAIYDIIKKYNIPKAAAGLDKDGKLDPEKGLGKILKNVRQYTYGGMFESINEKDVDRLMERVLRRLSR